MKDFENDICIDESVIDDSNVHQKHDDHYVSRRDDCGETIDIIEKRLLLRGIPEDYHKVVVRNYNICQAFKYIDRLDAKDEGDKELDKSLNYLFRSRHKRWM